MRLVRIDAVHDGMQLGRDVPSPQLGGPPLLRRGVRMSDSIAAALGRRSVRAVWIDDELSEGVLIVDPLPDDIRHATEQAAASCVIAARRATGARDRRLEERALGDIERAAASMVQALLDCPEAAVALDDLAGADSYTYTHSVRVATLGVLLGQRIIRAEGWLDWHERRRRDRVEERLAALATGLLVHDIGKISIPAEVLNKPGKLNAEEWELMKTHPEAGASLLPATRVSPLAICVVRDHHERWDGLGYPRGKRGDDIHIHARIAAVADVYDAVTAERPYKAATPPHVGWDIICEESGAQFDPDVVAHFRELVFPFPVGASLSMSNGAEGVVVSVDSAAPERPLIRYRDSGQLTERRHLVVAGVVQDDAEPGQAGRTLHQSVATPMRARPPIEV